MNPDVFLSHSVQDAHLANLICEQLESAQFRCWIAPRDIGAGQSWAASIVSALEKSRVFMLILTGHSNESRQVLREVELAVAGGLRIIPVRFQSIVLSQDLRYFLSPFQFLDVAQHLSEDALSRIQDSVQSAISRAETPSVFPVRSRGPYLTRDSFGSGSVVSTFFPVAVATAIVVVGALFLVVSPLTRAVGENIESSAAFASSWAAAVFGIWFLFAKAEDTLSDRALHAIRAWIRGLGHSGVFRRWPQHFVAIFDSVFGSRHLSWGCFFRSAGASCFFAVVLFLIWRALYPQDYEIYARPDNFLYSAAGAAVLLVILNVIPDYLSLLETRYVLRLMTRFSSAPAIVAFLILDLVATGLICFLTLLVLTGLGNLIQGSGFGSALSNFYLVFPPVEETPAVFMAGLTFLNGHSGPYSSVGIYIFATLLTSFWIWLYAAAGIGVFMLSAFRRFAGSMGGLLDVDRRPLRSMGLVGMMIVTAAYLSLRLFK